MVLWELTLATAYVLGLKRTYRLALRAQRRLLGRNHPRLREFTYRRTRTVFTLALNIYKDIQRRDITYGRSVGNWLLRILDRARPQANIRGSSSPPRPSPPRLEGGGGKESHAKHTQNGAESGSAIHARSSSESGSSLYTTQAGGHLGLSFRSPFANGFRLKQRSSARSFPVLAFGLWWQPVRRITGDLTSTPQSLSLPTTDKVRSIHVLQRGVSQQSVYREDIARWMGLKSVAPLNSVVS